MQVTQSAILARWTLVCALAGGLLIWNSAGLVAQTTADWIASIESEQALISVLQSAAPPQDKALACKRLAVFGGPAAVPALAPLLADAELASWARIALEAIPGPAADEALRSALAEVAGRQLLGVINSVGVRRDAMAVEALRNHLNSADPEVAAAASIALGRIGTEAAAEALQQSLASAPESTRSLIAEGCVLGAERLASSGNTSAAIQLYDRVRQADVSSQRSQEATRGAIVARGNDGIPLLIEQLQSADSDRFALALRVSRELPGQQVTEALLSQLAAAPPERQILLIMTLADRNDGAVLPIVLELAQRGPAEVRQTAIAVLGQIGDATCLPALLQIAAGNQPELAEAAKGALRDLPGDGVNAQLLGKLSQADGSLRRLLVELVGLRRIQAVKELVKAADDPDAQLRSAALTALGETVGPADLSVLVQRLVTPAHAGDSSSAQQALRAACVRMPDRNACTEQLVKAMERAPLPAQLAMLEIVGAVGGERALSSIATAATDSRPEMQDTASRLLGSWMTEDAAPVLLKLASSSADDKYKVRALRGYIRIARQFPFPDPQRAEMCRAALQAATRDAERMLVLEVLEQNPSTETFQLAVETSKLLALKDQASKVALAIAQKISGDSADLRQLLRQIGQAPMKVEILQAEYGAGQQVKDVTELLRQHVQDHPWIVLPSASYNASFGGDPAPNTPKQLRVRYRLDDKAGEVTLPENAAIVLPLPENQS